MDSSRSNVNDILMYEVRNVPNKCKTNKTRRNEERNPLISYRRIFSFCSTLIDAIFKGLAYVKDMKFSVSQITR